MAEETYTCKICTMRFHVGEPPDKRMPTTVCTQRNCGKRFWHCARDHNTARVGMTQKDYDKLQANA